ncbi:TPA: TolC family protein [Candidatus Avigastranaerophilus faecigallinarum]|nr:TolC family protein [Candidatus Avigastranaerophilus faecigallinarum]
MYKKILLSLSLLICSNYVFAIERTELNTDFFDNFNDGCLSQYINEAIENNHTAKQATARVEQYRQQTKSSLGRELPSLSFGANYLGIKIPDIDNFQLRTNAFILPFMANYEADILLKNRDKTKSTKKSYEASKQDEKAIYIALLTDVATTYTNILQYDEIIDKQKELVNISQEILDNNNRKFERGVINSTLLNNSRRELETVKNELENYKKQREIILMQLAVLVGTSPENKDDIQRGKLNDFEYQKIIPTEITSDVIFSRPDVIAAETMLEKARIDIKIARKEFLPTFNITGLWAFNTIAPGNFFSWESSLAALMAGAMQDIFTGGRKIASLKFHKAKYEELFENYKQVSLEAVKEVNTALCLIKHNIIIDNNTNNQLVYETKNYNDAQKMLNRGVISNNEYLNSKKKYIIAEIQKSQTKTQRIVNYYTLYKAAGGKL